MLSRLRGMPLGVIIGGLLRRRARCFGAVQQALAGRSGIEIGGPSGIFEGSGALPVYPLIASLEQFTFAGDASQGVTVDRADGSFDFVLSSHMLEHTANPLKALREWRRILKPTGHLLLVLPDKERTFDHSRRVTAMGHLIQDLERDTPESDLRHVDDAMRDQDIKHWTFRPWPAWREMYRNNAAWRAIHQHVFDMALAAEAVAYGGFRIIATEKLWPYHLVVFARLADAG